MFITYFATDRRALTALPDTINRKAFQNSSLKNVSMLLFIEYTIPRTLFNSQITYFEEL